MSVLLVNGEEQPTSFADGVPVGEIIQQHIDPLVPAGQVVCMIGVDDQTEDVDGLRWGSFQRLDVRTAHPYQLVVDGLSCAGEVLQDISDHMNRAAEQLRMGQQETFGSLFVAAIDNLLSFLRFVSLAVAHLKERGQPLLRYEADLKACIDQVFSAQQSGDSVLMADLLVFELVPMFERFESVRTDLIAELRQALDGVRPESKA